jgi:hypothetical protein
MTSSWSFFGRRQDETHGLWVTASAPARKRGVGHPRPLALRAREDRLRSRDGARPLAFRHPPGVRRRVRDAIVDGGSRRHAPIFRVSRDIMRAPPSTIAKGASRLSAASSRSSGSVRMRRFRWKRPHASADPPASAAAFASPFSIPRPDGPPCAVFRRVRRDQRIKPLPVRPDEGDADLLSSMSDPHAANSRKVASVPPSS